MEEYAKLLEKIKNIVEYDSYSFIEAGFSFEKKIFLKRENDGNLLLRLKKTEDKTQIEIKQKEFEVLKRVRKYSKKIPAAHLCGYDEDSRVFYMVLDYIEGEDAENTLNDYSEEIQYEIGFEAGIELKKMHSLDAPCRYKDWYGLKRKKYERYFERFRELKFDTSFLDINRVVEFVGNNIDLMKKCESKFQHDDFHPGNIIIADGKYKAAIDFNRYDWGDPVHDFYKVALFSRNISVPFSRGQVDGYTNGEPDDLFWKKYSLYSAMSIVPDMVWSYNYAVKTGDMEQLEHSKKRLGTIYEDHEGFGKEIPSWYD